ncbi:MAG: RNA-binding domain-containing protein [Anaerolineaceae bacterium]
MNRNNNVGKKLNQWYTMDIHIHTPASEDFQQTEVTYLDILQKAESRGINILSFTDHNTIAGYRTLMEEIHQLELLEKLNRLLPDERSKLNEYHRLLNKMVLLPGFEFTATFGFHILALFSTQKNIREIEHLLLNLSIPAQALDNGTPAIGASVDVLVAYTMIEQAGGLVIAAHANSTNGVAMRGLNFGGQTRIAYTQDNHLHALEVTDLELKGTRTTAAFFNGTKPEYPRRMHCIQGSDSHRLNTDPLRKKNLGIGDRATEVFLPEPSFEALKELFLSNDFSRTRPHRFKEEPAYDFVQSARDEGANIIQDFHENATVRGGKLYAVLSDICAFANTNGGTLFIGLSSDPHALIQGVPNPDQLIKQLEKEVTSRISPPLHLTMDVQKYKAKEIIRILIPRGDEPPYALDDNKIYIRDEDETNIAVRDEIVNLVLRRTQPQVTMPSPVIAPLQQKKDENRPVVQPHEDISSETNSDPRTGVEVIPPIVRDGKNFYSLRDLRNGALVKNVTPTSARRLWHYAISRYSEICNSLDKENISWQGDYGLLHRDNQGKTPHFDLIQKTSNGYRFFFGVTPDGIHGPWKIFFAEDEAN